MKSAVAVALILSGVGVLAIPPFADAWHSYLVVRLMEKESANWVNLEGAMGDVYRFGCWVLGAAMIAVAVFNSIKSGSDILARRASSSDMNAQSVPAASQS